LGWLSDRLRPRSHRATKFPVEPYTAKTGTPAAFFSEDGGRDIQASLIDYVSHFVTIAAGKRFNPHVTIGVGTETYLNKMLAEPFDSFTFSPTGASVYQLGTFGTARKELKALPLTPSDGARKTTDGARCRLIALSRPVRMNLALSALGCQLSGCQFLGQDQTSVPQRAIFRLSPECRCWRDLLLRVPRGAGRSPDRRDPVHRLQPQAKS
jgi:hypothetical protein